MECVKIGLLVLLALFAGQTESATDTKVVCYYDSQAYNRPGNGKFDLNFLDPALQFCTHLIYGYAGIKEENFNIAPLDESLDINKQNYKHIVELKRRFPGLRVLLSVGGNRDVSGEGSEKNLKYRTLLESVETRLAFINSAHNLVKTYGFDGLDLAWEFPETKPRKIRNKICKFRSPLANICLTHLPALASWFVNLKHKIAGESITDEKAEEHKEQFIALVREFKNAFRHDGILLTLSQLPNVNGTGLPANKLLLGIPTYGRAWKLNEDSGFTGVPPVAADGAADPGPYSNEAGLLSYPEICNKIANQKEIKAGYLGKLRKVNDPTKRYGTYAYRLPDQNGENGIWVGFEDPDTVGNKAAYAKAKGLGGIAVLDITLDDFRGTCVSDNFPLLRAAKYRL
ncbi:hypothetical protein HUJ05_003921 [Dendroctonus ponderosae]|nr:hypothetical protein HUJ05_003921 [Dendroctonus ponderosae]